MHEAEVKEGMAGLMQHLDLADFRVLGCLACAGLLPSWEWDMYACVGKVYDFFFFFFLI